MIPDPNFLSKRLKETPGDWELRKYLIEISAEHEDFDAVGRLIRDAPDLPESGEDLLHCIELAAKLDPWTPLGFAERAVLERPDWGVAHLAKARACLHADQPDVARRHYQSALDLDPSLVDHDLQTSGGLVDPADLVSPEFFAGERESESEPKPDPPLEPDSEPLVGEEIDFTPDLGPLAPVTELPVVAPLIDPAEIESSDPQLLAEDPALARTASLAYLSPEVLESTRSHLALPGQDGVILDADDFPAAGVRPGGELLVAESAPAPGAAEKEDQTKESISALLITVGVHVFLGILFYFIVWGLPRNPPPEITAVVQPGHEDQMPQKKEVVEHRPETALVQPTAAIQTITAAAMSPVSMPRIDFETPEAPVELGTSSAPNLGFGGSGAFGGGLPNAIKSRCSRAERAKLLTIHGGSARVSPAVAKALAWFADHQNPDGSWGRDYKGAMTGLALLCYLGNCETPDSPRYGDTVMQGLFYLVELSNKNEGIMAQRLDKHFSYEHGIATYAMGETYALAKYGKAPAPRRAGVVHPRGGNHPRRPGQFRELGLQLRQSQAQGHLGDRLAIPGPQGRQTHQPRVLGNQRGHAEMRPIP